jgi:hypothetical protein
MDCLELRRIAGADPEHLPPDAREHVASCPRCAEHLQRLRAFDERIRTALSVPVKAAPAAQLASPTGSIDRRRWLALAASIAGGVVVGSLLWVANPRSSLAHDLVEHVSHEPQALAHASPADADAVDKVLAKSGIRLQRGLGAVSYASNCEFRGQVVPHLVVQTEQGPVTVMVLRGEKPTAPTRFEEQGYSGTIVPAGPGSIAVIGGAGTVLEQVAAEVLQAVIWL